MYSTYTYTKYVLYTYKLPHSLTYCTVSPGSRSGMLMRKPWGIFTITSLEFMYSSPKDHTRSVHALHSKANSSLHTTLFPSITIFPIPTSWAVGHRWHTARPAVFSWLVLQKPLDTQQTNMWGYYQCLRSLRL